MKLKSKANQLRCSSKILAPACLALALCLQACGGGSVSVSNDSTQVQTEVLDFNLANVTVANSDLVTHYDFDQGIGNDIPDQSGNGYDGVAMPWDEANQSGTVWADGQHGNALTFSEGGRVTIASNTTLDNALAGNGISISLWYKLNDTNVDGYVRLVSKKPEWEQTEGFELDFNPVQRQIHLVCQGAHFIEGIVPASSIDNEWHHIVATLDGNTGSIRFDDQDITSINSVPLTGILACPHQLTIGALANGSADPVAPFQGTIDDLRIYNRALTVSEQQQLFVDTQDTSSSNELIAWWMADDSGSTIIDSSGYGHDGTASNMSPDTGFIGGALYGDNVDARVNVGGADTLALQGAMSISAWVKIDDPDQTHYMRILSKKVEDADLGGYEFAYYPLGNNLIFNGQGGMTAAVNVELGTGWNLLSVTVQDQDVTFYRNGQAIGSGQIAGLLQSDTPVYLGHRAREDADLPGAWFGHLDDIRIYNYALDASAVNAIYGETLRAPENPSSTYAGLLYDYYEGAWALLPDFDALTSVATGAIANFDISPRQRDSDFGFRFTGYVEILEHGEYTFYTNSDDGSQLFIGNTLIVDNDGLHSAQKRSGSIRLQAGLHAITGTFFERGGHEIFDVTYAGPSFTEIAIPDLRLHRDTGIDFPPSISLSIVNNISVAIEGASNLIAANVNDAEDGSIPNSSIVWSSSLDGALGTGGQFDVASLTVGDHVITCTATDSLSQSNSDTLAISIWPASALRDPDTPGAVINGVDYVYYEGNWSALPDFSSLSAVDLGTLAIPDLSPQLQSDYFGFTYSAYISIPSDGVYTFGLNSDDGSKLLIGTTTVVSNDGLHAPILRTGSIGLKAGLHEISIEYFERTGGAVLDVQWTGPGISTQTIPAAQYFRLDGNTLPQVSILSPGTVSSIQPGETINFTGDAIDAEDASIPALQWSWSSNLDGFIDNGSSASSDTLSDGVHTITLTVTDNDGASASDSVIVYVNTIQTGTINREVWLNIGGVRVSDLTGHANYANTADIEDTLTSFEAPTNWANNYGSRLRGYIHAPVTGAYTFWIASDDYSELHLSTDDDTANTSIVAQVPGWTNSRQWNKYSQQQSVTINLTAGQRYYVEALQKEGGGGDNLAVSWQIPGMSQEIIDGAYLSPFIPAANN